MDVKDRKVESDGIWFLSLEYSSGLGFEVRKGRRGRTW
jgi:hypothetical protein